MDIVDDNRMRSWLYLEKKRFKRLGISLERLNPCVISVCNPYDLSIDNSKMEIKHNLEQNPMSNNSKNNQLTPFGTMQKPTCGKSFSYDTNHRKPKLDLKYVDVYCWQSTPRRPKSHR